MDTEDGKVFIAFSLVALFLSVVISFFIRSLILQQKRYRILEDEKKESEFRAREKERFDIATELHNEIGPALASIKLRLYALDGLDRNEINACADALANCVQQIREISRKIAPLSVFNATFQQALEPYFDSIKSEKGLEISFHELNDLPLSAEAHTHIYRILQEIISNTIRHAQARQLIIETSIDGADLLIRTSDDGLGFDIQKIRSGSLKSMGLSSIERRISMLKGDLKFPERSKKGTRFNIRIPLSSVSPGS